MTHVPQPTFSCDCQNRQQETHEELWFLVNSKVAMWH